MSFVNFGTRSFVTANTNKAVFGNGISSGTANGSQAWMIRRTTIKDLTFTCGNPPLSTAGYTYQLRRDNVLIGPSISLFGTQTTTRVPINFLFPLPAGTSNALLYNEGFTTSSQGNPPPNQDINECFSYVCDAPDDDICILHANDDANNITLDPTSRFTTFGWQGVGASTTVESTAQIVWPITGTFMFMTAGHVGTGAGSTIDIFLRRNAVDTGLKVTLTNAILDVQSNFATPVSVTAGDLVNFRYIRTSGADTIANFAILVGFRSLII